MEALREGWLWHTGDPGLTSHALNAVARLLPQGDTKFERPKESRTVRDELARRRVIDALIAAAMVHTTAAAAWQAGADLSAGGYVHFTADDIVPHPGWWEAAVACCDSGAIPSARILNTDGSLQSSGAWATDLPEGMVTDIARIPFLSREQWQLVGPMIEVHYYTDNYVAVRAAQAGIPTIVCQAYEFTHHYAPEGRLDARMAADREVFERAVAA
jgi:hypothetical protein